MNGTIYKIEDDWDVNIIYLDKDKWLESLEYNLDVDIEYGDIDETDKENSLLEAKYETNDFFEANGFYYMIFEPDYFSIVSKDERCIMILNNDNYTLDVYKSNGENYECTKETKISLELPHKVVEDFVFSTIHRHLTDNERNEIWKGEY